MNYKPDDACFAAAKAASQGKLTDGEILQAFQTVADEKGKLITAGKTDRMAERLQAIVDDQLQRAQIAAAMQKRHAALNVLVNDRLDAAESALMKQGLKPNEALLALMRGTQRGIEGGRVSVDANKLAYRGRYIGDMFAQIQRERPEVEHMLTDKAFDNDIVREMMELREGGKPGVTGNADAQYVAKVYATYAEMSRVELNKLGASIGKLDGWAGAQTHDDMKLIAAGKQTWVDAIRPMLDDKRTFPEAQSEGEVREILEGIYDTIVTGVANKPRSIPAAGRVNPANLAKSLGKERVLHFKNADAVIAYRDRFGFGNTSSSIIAHQMKAGDLAAQMEMFGPNPENMLQRRIDKMARDIKDNPLLSPEEKQKRVSKLRFDGGAIRDAFDIMSGLATRPVNATFSKISSEIRAVQSMAKLGGATISSMPADTVTVALASQFRGGGFWKGLTEQIGGIMHGRPAGEQKEIAYLLGEGFDAIIGHVNAAAVAQDAPMGVVSRQMERFFKWNGMAWWDQVSRSVATRSVAAEMGMRAKSAFEELPRAYQHVLGLHGIDPPRWEAIRQAEARVADGRTYITGDRIRELDDEVILPLVEEEIAKVDTAKPGAEKRITDIYDRARFDLEMKVRALVADETRYGMLSTDAASRQVSTLGTRPGTIAGEAIRFVMQFKGFPIAFTQRVLGRAIFGQRKDATILEKGAHIGALIGGLGAAGYMSMVMKDTLKGYWPPRDPSDPKVMLAAFQQGGALGIYGDYLFGQASRFGNSALETAAGPTIGTASDLINTMLKTRDYAQGKLEGGKAASPAAQWINLLQGNTPFANLFYVKPALDYLILDNVKDWATPGHTARMIKQRKKEYGQKRAF